MNESLSAIFQEFVSAHADEEPIDFKPLLEKYPQHQEVLQKKIQAYQMIVGAMGSVDPPRTEKLSPFIGREIGSCRIVSILGQGGMGVAYLARQEKLARDVVVKVLRPFAAESTALRERFLRESRSIGKLTHRGIVPVYDVGEDNGNLYIIMQYVAGVPLNRILEEIKNIDRSALRISDIENALRQHLAPALAERVCLTGKGPTEFFCTLIMQVAEAVQYAHDNGIIHRDIKPSNIIIEPDGTPVLVDFGMSHDEIEKNLTISGEFLGTPVYTAPEVFLSKGIIPNLRQLDVYSLGVTLYECLTGGVPYRGESVFEVYKNALNAEPIAPHKKWKRIPKDLETIVLLSIFKQPEQRYSDVREFADDVKAFIHYEPIKRKRPSVGYRVMFWIGHNHKATIILILTIFIVGAGVFKYWRDSLHVRIQQRRSEASQLYRSALEQMNAGDLLAAEEKLIQVNFLDPENALAFVARARLDLKRNKYDHAIEHMRSAIRIDDRIEFNDFLSGILLIAGKKKNLTTSI